MTAEPEETGSPVPDSGRKPASKASAAGAKGTKSAAKPRYGVPVWRVGKPDAFLAASVDVARAAVEGIAEPGQVGRHLAAKSEGDRLVTHLFESKLPGYGGWQWYAVLTRNSRSKVVTVDELGLLPSEDSILAPEWVPWAERVRPEDAQPDDGHEDTGAEHRNQSEAESDNAGSPDAARDDAVRDAAQDESGQDDAPAESGTGATDEPGDEPDERAADARSVAGTD
ncbi:DUF3027 domain-containing protein [Arthrobacter sp. NPDC080082]|uniref:DUF3027 domain-containing protein n=1 Tax=unclassified Arthrobacter TaxID=235627 RepID=UPI0034127940